MCGTVAFSPYELSFKKEPGRIRRGALLRFDFKGCIGYADCHPWPELGDSDLKTQLDLLRQRSFSTPTLERALAHAKIDAAARSNGKNLLANLLLPTNNYLFMDVKEVSSDELQRLKTEGFTYIKIKVGKDLVGEAQTLNQLSNDLKPFKLRLDFNERIDATAFEAFFKDIRGLQEQIDFCEDPFPYDKNLWRKVSKALGVAFGCDRKVNKELSDDESALVIKPAIQNPENFLSNTQRIIFTSYLDHPLGQLMAAYEAGKFYQRNPLQTETCGLITHHVYTKNAFSERLSWGKPKLEAVSGMGVGFDDLLLKQKWTGL